MYKLYTFSTTRGVRPVWMLKELGVKYETVEIHLGKGEHQSDSFSKLNPLQKLPVLQDGELIVRESAAICQYLAEKHPENGFIPDRGTRESAKYFEWMFFACNELESYLWLIEKNTWYWPEEQRSKQAIETAKIDIDRSLKALDASLDREYIIGERFTTADIVLGYAVNWAGQRKMLEKFPRVSSYLERLKARPCFPHELWG